ncbi:TPA: hypothetical protein ACGFUY_000542 [Flavobacterium psychrophilum]
MNFIKKLFRIKEELKTPKFNTNDINIEIDLSPEGFQKRKDEYEIIKQNSWLEINKISIRDDGVVFYDTQFVNSYEEELVDFYGIMKFSENKEYCVVFVKGFGSEKGIVALVNTTSPALLYKININSPHKCNVSNNGIVVCNDWNLHNSKSTSFFVFDINGNVIFSKRMNENIGDLCLISKDGTQAAFDTLKTYSINIVNIQKNKITHKFSKEQTKKIDIDFDKKTIILEYFDSPNKIKDIC